METWNSFEAVLFPLFGIKSVLDPCKMAEHGCGNFEFVEVYSCVSGMRGETCLFMLETRETHKSGLRHNKGHADISPRA